MKKLPGKTACGFVWSGISTDTMGRLRPCCRIDHPITDQDGNPYHIDRPGDLERFWVSPTMNEIRKAGIEGKWHELCAGCQKQEENGGSSQRMVYDYLFNDNNLNLSRPQFKILNLLLTNKCNMKCRMCRPKNSHLLGREAKKYKLLDLWGDDVWGDDQVENYSNPVSLDDNAVVNLIDAYHESMQEIQFAGGEPFLSDTHILILKKLVDLGVSSNITITYNTNGTIPMDSYFDIWSKFKRVSVSISIDATEELANYIRYPTNWATVNRNMKALDDASSNVIRAKVNTMVQALSVLRLDDICEWLESFEHICKIPTLKILILPDHQHIKHIPLILRKESARKLENRLENYKKIKPSFKFPNQNWYINMKYMQHVIEYIKNEPDINDSTEFLKFNLTLDRVRKLDLFTVLSELIPYFKDDIND